MGFDSTYVNDDMNGAITISFIIGVIIIVIEVLEEALFIRYK